MKKLAVFFAMACMVLASGIALSACNSSVAEVTLQVEESSSKLVELVVKENDKVVEGRGNSYKFEKGTNLRVELVATTFGVDFSEVVVKVNGEERTINASRDYNRAYGSTDLVYGNFALANINQNLKVSVSGVKSVGISYDFEVENAEDETAVANLAKAYIDPTGEGNFVSLNSFLSDDSQNKLERLFTNSNYNSFNIKFGDPTIGQNIFDLYNSNAFKLRSENGEEQNANCTLTSNGCYIISFEKVVEEKYTIIIDLKDLLYVEYSITPPEEDINYSISAPNSINYLTEGTVTITKNTQRKSLVFDNMKVYLNDLALELSPECNLQNDTVLTYLIPKNITPLSTSNYGEVYYIITVKDIEYSSETHILNVAKIGNKLSKPALTPKVYLLDENDEKVGTLPQTNGQCVVAEGEKVAIFWEYSYDVLSGNYLSKYDLFDFDIYVDDKLLVVDQEEPEEELPDEGQTDESEDGGETQTEEAESPSYETVSTTLSLADKISKTAKENQTIDLGNGYVLQVFYDAEKDAILSMQLEFVCNNDKTFNFINFKPFTEDVSISYDFDDSRISSVEYAVINDVTNWVELEKGTAVIVNVKLGQTVVFRLSGTAFVNEADFGLEDSSAVLDGVRVSTYSQGSVRYTEFRWTISESQYNSIQGLKLIAK